MRVELDKTRMVVDRVQPNINSKMEHADIIFHQRQLFLELEAKYHKLEQTANAQTIQGALREREE